MTPPPCLSPSKGEGSLATAASQRTSQSQLRLRVEQTSARHVDRQPHGAADRLGIAWTDPRRNAAFAETQHCKGIRAGRLQDFDLRLECGEPRIEAVLIGKPRNSFGSYPKDDLPVDPACQSFGSIGKPEEHVVPVAVNASGSGNAKLSVASGDPAAHEIHG